jgi:arabinose-5-phosphate isomerase
MISAEALKIMHDKKITNLFVLEGKKPIGVIHIHDLLNNGVA